MPRLANWFQWTVVFLFLGLGAWIAYPVIDPLDGNDGISFSLRVKPDASKTTKIAAFGRGSRQLHRKPLFTVLP